MLAPSAGGRLGRHHNQRRVQKQREEEEGGLNQANDFCSFVCQRGEEESVKKKEEKEGMKG